MELTNKVNYLLVEYQTKYHPLVLRITDYLNIIQLVESTPLTGLPDAVAEAEYILAKEGMLGPLKLKIKALAQSLILKGEALAAGNDDHVTDMASNVEDDTQIAQLTAQTNALITTIAGMSAISPGGGAGAVLVTAQNAAAVLALGNAITAKDNQVATATAEVPQLVAAGVELATFAALVARVL